MNALERALAGGVEVPNPAYNKRSKKGRLQPKTIISTDYTKDPSLQMARAFARNASPIQYNLNQYNDEPFEEYDVYINPIDTRQDLERQRAENQGALEQTGRAISQIGGEVVLGMARTFIDIGDYVNQKLTGQSDYTSELGEALRNAQDEWNKNNEIYQLEPGRFNLFDWGYLMSNMVTLGNILSLAIPGVGITKGLGLIGKALRINKGLSNITRLAATAGRASGQGLRFNPYRVNKTIGNATELALSAGISRIGENYMEAHDTYENVYNNIIENLNNMNDEERELFYKRNPEFVGKTNEEIATNIAGESANDVFNKDMWLMAFDMMQLRGISKMWKGASKIRSTRATREAQEQAIRSITGQAAEPISRYKKFIRGIQDKDWRGYAEALTEAPEEMWQSATQSMALQEAQDILKYNPEKKDYLDFLTDDDALESGFWGVAAGLLFKGIGEAAGYGYNKLQDKLHKKEDENISDYSHRRQESILDMYRTAEINSRAAAYNKLSNDLQLIEKGYDPDSPLMDANGSFARNENGDIIYEELASDAIKEAKENKIREFVTTLTMNAYDRGNLASLKEFFKKANVKEYLEKNDVNINDVQKVDAIIDDQMAKVERMYDYELNRVANNSVDEAPVRQIARENILNRIEGEKHANESAGYLSIHANLLSKITNEDDRQNLIEAESKIKAEVYEREHQIITKRINDLKKRRRKKNDKYSFAQYQEQLALLEKRKRTLELAYLNGTTTNGISNRKYDENTEKEYNEAIKANRNRTIVSLARTLDNDVVTAYEGYVLNDIYSKYKQSDVRDTAQQIQEESRRIANSNEKFIEQEYKRATRELNNIINDASININDLNDYFTALLNRDREATAMSPLTRTQKSRINKAVRAYDLFNATNAPISEYIRRRIAREAKKRNEAQGTTVDVTTGKTMTSTNTPSTGGGTQVQPSQGTQPAQPAQGTNNANNSKPPVREDGEAEAAGANVGQKEEEQPTQEEETELARQARQAKEKLEDNKNKEETVNKLIAEEINNLGDLNDVVDAFSRDRYNQTIEDIKTRVFSKQPDLTDVIDNMFNDPLVVVGHVINKFDKLEDAMNIDYVIDTINDNLRNSVIGISTLKMLNESEGDLNFENIKQLLDEYTKIHNNISKTQNYYVNINSLVKFICKQFDNKFDIQQVKKLYKKVARALNRAGELNKYGDEHIKFKFNNPFGEFINDKTAADLINNAIRETNLGTNESAISSPLDDRRINIFNSFRVEAGETIYYEISPNGDNIEFYRIEGNRAIHIGSNTIAKKVSPDDGTNFGNSYYVTINKHGTPLFLRFQKIDDLNVASTFDDLIRGLYPIETGGNNVGDNKRRDEPFNTIYNELGILYDLAEANVVTEKDVETLYNIPMIKELLERKNIFGGTNKIYKAVTLARFIFDTIEGFDKSDSNYITLQSYENYKRRIYSNYDFTEKLYERAKSNGAKARMVNKIKHHGLKNNCSLTIATSSEGELLVNNNPEVEAGEIRDRVVDFDNKVDKGEISLMYVDNNSKMHFSNTPRTFEIPGYKNKGNLLLSVDNGSKMPTFVPIEAKTVDVTSGLGLAISDEITDLILKFQTNESFSLQNLQDALSKIIGYKNLINLQLALIDGNKLIISFKHESALADIEIGVIRGGNRQIRFRADIDPATQSPIIRDTIDRDTLKEQLNNVLSKATYALSYDFSTYGNVIDTPYVTKNDNEFTVTIGGKIFTSQNYIKFIADNKLGLTDIMKRKVNGRETNFTNIGVTGPRGNRNVQVLLPTEDKSMPVSESLLINVYSDFLGKFSTSKTGQRYIDRDKFIDTYLPRFKKDLKSFRFGSSMGLLNRIEYSDRNDVDAYYNIGEDKIYITKKGIAEINKKATYNVKSAEEELARLLIHENLHRILNKSVAGKKILDNIDNIKTELNEIGKTLNEILSDTNTIEILKSRLNFDIEKAIRDLLNVSGFNTDTNKFEGTIAQIEEFIVETMTRPQYINLLNNIRADNIQENTKKTLWDKFIDWLTKLFGINIDDTSLLRKEINAISSIYNEKPPVGEVVQATEAKEPDGVPTDTQQAESDNVDTETKVPEEPVSKTETSVQEQPKAEGRVNAKREERRRERRRRQVDDAMGESFSTINIDDYNTNSDGVALPNLVALSDSVELQNKSNLMDSVYSGALKMQC